MILIDGKEWCPVSFPNGETQFKLPWNKDEEFIRFFMRYDEDYDVFCLYNLIELGYRMNQEWRCIIVSPYLPYSRSDRLTEQNEHPVLTVMAKIFNHPAVMRVECYDIHSKVAKTLCGKIDEFCFLEHPVEVNKSYLDYVIEAHGVDYLFFPDEGAQNRYGGYKEHFPCFVGEKMRGDGGKLSNFRFVNPPDLKDKVVCIVDDICSKGGTAHTFAQMMREAGARNVVFMVAHCEQSIHQGMILKDNAITAVYTTDSIRHAPHVRIHDIILPLFNRRNVVW